MDPTLRTCIAKSASTPAAFSRARNRPTCRSCKPTKSADTARQRRRGDRMKRREFITLLEPDVLDRDHCLVGEGLNQLDLLVGERMHFGADQNDHADRDSLAQQWHAEHCAKAADLGRFEPCIFGISENIGHMNSPALKHSSPDDRASPNLDRMSFDVLDEGGWVVERR